MTDVQSGPAGSNSQEALREPAESVQAPRLDGNPAVLGLMVFATGSLVLAISLFGNVPLAVQPASIQPIVYAGTGLGLLIATIWAASLQQTFVATILGTFAGFWLSYTAMVEGLLHNWYGTLGTPPGSAIPHTLGQFLIGWDVAIFMLFLVTLRLPLVFSLILGAGTIGVAFLAVAVMGTGSAMYHVGGVFVLIFAILGYYAYLSGALESVGGKGLPLGKPVVSYFEK